MTVKPNREFELLSLIRRTSTGPEKDRLIQELDEIPANHCPFYARWTRIHETWDFEGWTDDGYDSSRVSLPRDVQLLSATEYGVSDIINGGLHQFFGNGTGVFAPEMIEWFGRARMPEAAAIMRVALDKFGGQYTRSHELRRQYLHSLITDGKRSDWDPFYELDDHFYACLSGGNEQDYDAEFTKAADHWLRETCGVSKLSDPPRKAASS